MKLKNKLALLCLEAAVATTWTSCSDDDEKNLPTEIDYYQVSVLISLPDDANDLQINSETLSCYNISNGQTYTFTDLNDVTLMSGIYDITYVANVTNGGVEVELQGKVSSVEVLTSGVVVVIDTYLMTETNDLLISEIFFTGTLYESGNQYTSDGYIKLYNNTNNVIYADGLSFFESTFLTTDKYDYRPDIMGEAMTIQALYTIPGSGKEHPVQPGEYLLLVDVGIDHRVSNPNSFDLSSADFEWYDESSNPDYTDIDSPTVPNLDKWYSYSSTVFILHNRGFKAWGIARIPIDKDTYLEDYYYDYEYDMDLGEFGLFPMDDSSYKLPNEWIVDVVNCSVASDYVWNVCDPSLDMGWTYCGTIDNDKTRYFHSVRRKMLYLNDAGNPVLKDTNNSSVDFNPYCTPSEIEIQGTAIDANGTPCTTLTYDGVTPIN